jgi:UPF0755 protein
LEPSVKEMTRKKIRYIIAGLLFAICSAGFFLYTQFFSIRIYPVNGKAVILIPEDATWKQAMDSLRMHLSITNQKSLEWISKKKGYPRRVLPGRYVITRGVSCNQLINILRGGKQAPVMVTFNNVRTLGDLAGKVGGQIEADSLELVTFLLNTANYSKDGFTRDNIISVFIPDTYEFFWNTGPQTFYRRMLREYRKFWTDDRIRKAKDLNLTPVEVSTLASIVDEEAIKPDEKPRIAGVYINRLRRGIPLQADPTVKFAVNNFTISRILNKHLAIDSPYNTYIHKGLPPGPISCPSVEGLNAVLNPEKHDFIYFAAKADFSGYHNFSRTLAEHNRYANQYQRELNRRRIFR